MREIKINEDDRSAAINYNSLLQFYIMEQKKNQMTYNIIRAQYTQFTNELYQKYDIKDDESFVFDKNFENLKISKVEKKE